MAQSPLRLITISSILRSPEFALGIATYEMGLPLGSDIREGWAQQWCFERGRLFAIYCKHRGIKVPRLMNGPGQPNGVAVQIYKQGRADGYII